MENLLFLQPPGTMEWFVILVVALLLFGKRLPEVARSMGRSITEFKKGLQNMGDKNEQDQDADASSHKQVDQHTEDGKGKKVSDESKK